MPVLDMFYCNLYCISIFYLIKVNEDNLENVTHEEAVASLKATQEVVKLRIAKPSYVPDQVTQEPSPPGNDDIKKLGCVSKLFYI